MRALKNSRCMTCRVVISMRVPSEWGTTEEGEHISGRTRGGLPRRNFAAQFRGCSGPLGGVGGGFI